MSGLGRGPERVRMPYVERLMQGLSDRDWEIIGTLRLLRLASGLQLERLHFHNLAGRSRQVMRWRVLKRLVDARVLVTLERRIGSSRRGSAGLCYTLDSAGQRLARLRVNRGSQTRRERRPRSPGDRFVAHTLAVTGLYVSLVEHHRLGWAVLDGFQAEADAYWPNGLGGWLKPDAFVKLRRGTVTDYWWYEADLATESLPTIRNKLLAYLDFARRGQLGPDGVVPRVMFGVPTSTRHAAIQSLINDLPEPAEAMFLIESMSTVTPIMAKELMKQ